MAQTGSLLSEDDSSKIEDSLHPWQEDFIKAKISLLHRFVKNVNFLNLLKPSFKLWKSRSFVFLFLIVFSESDFFYVMASGGLYNYLSYSQKSSSVFLSKMYTYPSISLSPKLLSTYVLSKNRQFAKWYFIFPF